MHVVITGASGLIGRALAARLAADGHRVTRLVRAGASDTAPPGTVRWDPAAGTVDRAGLGALGPVDGVVHLSGAGIGDKRWSPARTREILDSRTRSTATVVDVVLPALTWADGDRRVLVSASAVGYYGDRGDEELTEASPPGTGFLADVCTAWEAAAAPAADAGIRTVLLRTGIVLTTDGGVWGKQLPLFRLGLGGPVGGGRQYRSWITLEDEVAAVVHALGDDGLAGPVNATAPHPVTDRELATAVGAVLHRPTVLPVPAAALRLVLGRDMADELVLAGQRVLPEALLARGFRFAHPTVDEAVRALLAPGA